MVTHPQTNIIKPFYIALYDCKVNFTARVTAFVSVFTEMCKIITKIEVKPVLCL